jgi:putative salt-induced outer membrane protein YdiY
MPVKKPTMLLPIFIQFVIVCLINMMGPVNADEVEIKNGDKLSGTVQRMEEDTLVLSTSYAGDISISWGQIATLQTENPITIVMRDTTTLEGTLVVIKTGEIGVLPTNSKGITPLKLSDIIFINPPRELLYTGIRTRGRFNFGIIFQKGNTNKEQYNFDGEGSGRGQHNRYKLEWDSNLERDSANTTVQNASISGNIDRFITKKLFLATHLTLEHDRLKDLDLRATGGGEVGYQFLESTEKNLSLRVGLSYVKEFFTEDNDTDFYAFRWRPDFDYTLYKNFAQFFHTHTGIWNLKESGRVIIQTKTGFRLPIADNFNTTFQLDLDWDSETPSDAKQLDAKYRVTAGYNW